MSTPQPGWMPGTDRSQIYGGNAHKATVDKIVLHTTEGGSWPGYNNGSVAPHFTVHRGAYASNNIRQHIPTTQSSKALENDSGGVETNNDGCIQIELIGSCDKSWASQNDLFFTENADDDDLDALAHVVAWIAAAHGVPLTDRGLAWTNTNAATETSPQRMSYDKWRGFSGVCGHIHVPENEHWDPGKFPIDRLLALAKGQVPDDTDHGDGHDDYHLIVDGRFGTSTSSALQRYLVKFHGADIAVDGRMGHDSWVAWQEAVNAPYKDGVISRQSYRATELGNGIVEGASWEYTGRGSSGSQSIELMQKWAGATVDGILYEGTTSKVQSKLNTYDLT